MTNFTAGDRVQVVTPGQTDSGLVVKATHDEDGRKLRPGQVAVRIDNGQGTWGYAPSRLSALCWKCDGPDLQAGGTDDTGAPITTCAECGARQEQE